MNLYAFNGVPERVSNFPSRVNVLLYGKIDRMEPRISIITLGVKDLDRSLHFYRDGLGFTTTATIEKPARNADWGGYSGYFSDPDGYLWEIAWGAFEIRTDGSLLVT